MHDLIIFNPEIDPCDSSPCANSGSCTSMGPFDFTCECAAGYDGPTCEVDVDECLTAVCPTNSMCVDSINSYVCVCNPGFEDQCTPVSVGDQGDTMNNLTSGATDKTQLAKKSNLTIVVGAAIGGLVGMLVMIIIIIIISICICLKRKTKQLSYDLPGNHQGIVYTHQF